MIEKKIICDRCGRECENFRYSRGERVFRNKFFLKKTNDDNIDLCQECYDSLSKWMNAESEEQKSGKWQRASIEKYIQHAMAYYVCSECGGQTIGEPKYCPNCGAYMIEPQESEVRDEKETC